MRIWILAALLLLASKAGAQQWAPASVCSQCHVSDGVIMQQDGQNLSPVDSWSATMMAFSAQDPYWRAKMSAEVAARPGIQSLIESECITCHAPLGKTAAKGAYGRSHLDEDTLGLDGVSCLACHKIEPDGLGSRAKMSGHFSLGTGEMVYGPYPNPLQRPMWMHTGFVPVQGEHIGDAGLCGSCHNLYTPILDANNQKMGQYAEQVIYSEWAVSDYGREGLTCQQCHVVSYAHENRISLMPPFAPVRSPIWDHRIVGGNTFMVSLLRTKRDALGLGQSDFDFEATLGAAREFLQSKTLDLMVTAQTDGDSLDVVVTLTNRSGHKFPTGYPERRAWIHVRVIDDSGALVFESGAVDSLGYIQGVLRRGYVPHQDVIRRAETVQIYEIVPGDRLGKPTRRLLSSAQSVKDNRLLPSGFHPEGHALGSDVPVVGVAVRDPNFDAEKGRDQVVYRLTKPGGTRANVEVSIYYQAVPPEAIDDLRAFETPDVREFLEMVDHNQLAFTEVVARQHQVVEW